MKRSELKAKYLKKSALENFNKFRKQKNFCSRLYKKERRKFLDKLDIKLVTDNKKFQTNIKPFLIDKTSKSCKITLVEGDEIISADKFIAQKFDKFNENTVSFLNILCEVSLLMKVMAWKIQLRQLFKNSKTNLGLRLLHCFSGYFQIS